jgi:hypothetical protein
VTPRTRLAGLLRALAARIDPPSRPTARNRAVVPGGYAQGRADLQLTHRPPSHGYLPDAETWRPTGPHATASPEAVTLMRIDRVLGNEATLSETGVGRVRSLTLNALQDWHRRHPVNQPAGDQPPTHQPQEH